MYVGWMKRNIYIAIAALAVCGLFVALHISPKRQPVSIGFVGPFTGNSAFFGEYMQRGLDIARSEYSADDISRVRIIKEDDACSAKNALSAVQKLISVDHVKYVIGPLCNESSVATEQLFEDSRVISVTIGLPSNKIANMGPYHFSFSPEIEYLMKAISGEIIKKKITRVAVIHMIGAFEDENYRHFIKYLSMGGVWLAADVSEIKGTTDFKASILKIKQSNPDGIMIVAHTAELNNILKQMDAQGLRGLQKFGIHAAETKLLLEQKDIAEGFIYPYPGDDAESQSAKSYAQKYADAYHAAPDPSSVNVYNSYKILISAIGECGYENSDCVQRKLSQLKDFPGASGSLSVDERGVGTYKQIMLKTVHNGKFEKLSE
ncbi:MAG: Extracellular ligand-binding receptor [Candidatus Taylorbacteria bacterium]|nr:Extracellular ligand-binding receptor [Candidatus Taylorbacteria bacterium]